MSVIDVEGIPVKGRSMANIEGVTEKYLKIWQSGHLKRPSALDVDELLQVSIGKSHGFMMDLVTGFENPSIEARTLMTEKKIQITQTCFNRIGANDGRSRYHVTHEISHVVLQYEEYRDLRLNPARMERRPCQTYEDPEWQAEHGGGAFLMPLCIFIPFVEERIRKGMPIGYLSLEIIDTYKVSKKAALSRLRQFTQKGLWKFLERYAFEPGKLRDCIGREIMIPT